MRDREIEVDYDRTEAGVDVAVRFVRATAAALDRLENNPRIGSPTLGKIPGLPGLRLWRVDGFPLVWLYFEHSDHLDVIRLLGERQISPRLSASGIRIDPETPDAEAVLSLPPETQLFHGLVSLDQHR